MSYKRIIPCLDIKDGRTVKGVNFENVKAVGDPVIMALDYQHAGADELVLLDISATLEGRKTFVDLVRQVAAEIELPFAVGGGIASVEDARRLIDAGAAKVSINSAAVIRPELIDELVDEFGRDRVVIAIDARRIGGLWMVTTHGGTRVSDRGLYEWTVEVEGRGAGEVLFTSMDHDGTKSGYPCDVFRELNRLLSIPVIASGGAGRAEDILEVLTDGCADAALAASIFHFGEVRIRELKEMLIREGVEVKS